MTAKSDETGLNAAEIAGVWFSYTANTMSRCMTLHFLRHVDDADTRSVLETFMKVTQENIANSRWMMEKEGFPIPVGFTGGDVRLDAPRLFNDHFYLLYLRVMSGLGLMFYSVVYQNTIRKDVRTMFAEMVKRTIDLHELVTGVALDKAIMVMPPLMPYPEPSFVTKASFLTGFLGEKRKMNCMEITQLYSSMQFNMVKNVMLTGFSQVAQDAELRKYFIRGVTTNNKQMEHLAEKLKEDHLPAPVPSTMLATDSTTPPYSDKLMLFHVTNLSSAKLRNFGDGLSLSPRHDLAALYLRLMGETGTFAELGARMEIERGWMERIPQTADREELAGV